MKRKKKNKSLVKKLSKRIKKEFLQSFSEKVVSLFWFILKSLILLFIMP